MCLTDQPRSMNSTASQSSSSGCDGFAPLRPKLLVVSTSGRPKCQPQTWFTATRAVSGLSRFVSQFARAARRPLLVFGYCGVSGVYFADATSAGAQLAAYDEHPETAGPVGARLQERAALNYDWDDVAASLPTFGGPAKTAIQCRHKIEKLRKRYRGEKQRCLTKPGKFSSSWDLFPVLDAMELASVTSTAVEPNDQDVDRENESNGVDEFRV